jgi:hypothetical protein
LGDELADAGGLSKAGVAAPAASPQNAQGAELGKLLYNTTWPYPFP